MVIWPKETKIMSLLFMEFPKAWFDDSRNQNICSGHVVCEMLLDN